MNPPPIIVLLTDFGLSDAYVGTMKGVMLSICPSARLVDLTHAIEPQNVRQAAYVLLTAFRYFPPHTVFLIVVDPGVGTAREPVAVAAAHGLYVAPNNGVLSYVLPHVDVQHTALLQNTGYQLPAVSQTFHGRDIFGPAAAHLANGVPVPALGPPPSELVRLTDPRLDITPTCVHGEVLHIDHFGNIITSIGRLAWTGPDTLQLQPQFGRDYDHPVPFVLSTARCRVTVGTNAPLVIHRTYGAVSPGTPTALVGSSGQLEIGINQGSAAQVLAVLIGDAVTLTFS
jgi:S-adenosylmethionine hydrolase